MRALAFLDRPPPAEPSPGLATADPRFARITQLDEAGEHPAAVDAALALLDEGVWDVRLLAVMVHAAFREGGVPALATGLEGLHALLEQHGDKLGPDTRRALHVHKSLASLFERAERELAYHEKKGDAAWLAARAEPESAARAAEAARALLSAQPEASRASLDEPASKLLRHLRELAETPREAEPTAEGPAEVDAEPEAPPPARPEAAGERLEITPSPALRALLTKLRAFETLIERGEMRKAALVAADVQGIIEAFDPRVYFPELFAGFGGLLAEHIDTIAPLWEQRDSMSWRMLAQHYQVDLEGFVGDD